MITLLLMLVSQTVFELKPGVVYGPEEPPFRLTTRRKNPDAMLLFYEADVECKAPPWKSGSVEVVVLNSNDEYLVVNPPLTAQDVECRTYSKWAATQLTVELRRVQ